MEDQDENVIFKDSPLYNHLTDVGITDTDIEPVQSEHTSLHSSRHGPPDEIKNTVSCLAILKETSSFSH
ncbi:hypothetical protein ScPMuIL_007375 [Solemya velum]